MEVTGAEAEPGGDVLTIELEDAGTRSLGTSLLGLLTSTTQQWHFVGLVSGELRYSSATFAAPYGLGPVTPREAWAPGMGKALDELRGQIAAAGWVEVGHGEQPWQGVYRRTDPNS